jgi:hypothetical protein
LALVGACAWLLMAVDFGCNSDECELDWECGAGKICTDGQCTGCEDASDCDDGEACRDERCTFPVPLFGACSSDEDCQYAGSNDPVSCARIGADHICTQACDLATVFTEPACVDSHACEHGCCQVVAGASEGICVPRSARVDAILALPADPMAGAVDFPSTCGLGASPCHEVDGTSGGGMAADLTLVAPLLSDREIVTAVLEGSGQMPSQSSLEDQTIANLLAYIRAAWGP